MDDYFDVVVVGAGPVGLLLAIELTLAGVSVLVVERLSSRSQVAKALGIGPLGIEAMQRRGLSESILTAQTQALLEIENWQREANAPPRSAKFSGHFAGLTLIRADAQKDGTRRVRPVNQQAAEAMLEVKARSLGVEVRRDTNVKNIVQLKDGVDVEWTSPATAGTIRSSYVVGCDGGRSSIRKMAGFDFPGTPPTMTMYQASVSVDYPERLSSGFQYTSGGMFAYGFFPNRLILMDFSGPPEDRLAPVSLEDLEAVLRRVSCEDVRITSLEDCSKWTDNTRLVDCYRKERVLLAGDAAHIHSPFGGQGMSLGLVDAANLGWKLASVIRGEMPETLLDTYNDERRPVAEAVLANTRAQTAIMRPDPQSGAMREIVATLMQFDDVNQFFGEMMSGVGIRYDFNSDHADVGRLLADTPISGREPSVHLYELMQDGRGILIDASPDGHASKLVDECTQRIHCIKVDTNISILIRPDACVAWVGENKTTNGLQEALDRWFRFGINQISAARSGASVGS